MRERELQYSERQSFLLQKHGSQKSLGSPLLKRKGRLLHWFNDLSLSPLDPLLDFLFNPLLFSSTYVVLKYLLKTNFLVITKILSLLYCLHMLVHKGVHLCTPAFTHICLCPRMVENLHEERLNIPFIQCRIFALILVGEIDGALTPSPHTHYHAHYSPRTSMYSSLSHVHVHISAHYIYT